MARKFDRIIMVVIDGLGVGSAPDAAKFADQGADTLGRLVSHFRARLQLPTLERLGLGEVHPLFSYNPAVIDHVYYGQTHPAAIGKTILEGKWELQGVTTTEELTAFPQGFPSTMITSISNYAGRPVLGNQVASLRSGLKRWGREQTATGGLIIFTSGGSDLWITAHESTMSLEELRRIGHYVRYLFNRQAGINLEQVATVLFTGNSNLDYRYQRETRQLLTMATPAATILEQLRAQKISAQVVAGKDINTHLSEMSTGLLMTWLKEVDLAGAHRNPEKMGRQLMEVDQELGKLLPLVQDNDLLLVTASHGNDPDFPGSAITREWVPVLAYSPCLSSGRLADRASLADIAALILENFGITSEINGKSFLTLLK